MRIVRPLLSILFIVSALFSSNAQDLDSLHHFILKNYSANASFSIEYSSYDFYSKMDEKDPLEELSYEQIDRLKDSLAQTDEKIYLVRIGQLYNRLNEKTKGQKWLLKALAAYSKDYISDPDSYEMLCDMVILHIEMGQLDHAIDKTERILELRPDNVDYVLIGEMLHIMMGNYDEAIRLVDEAQLKFPQEPGLNLMKTMADVFNQMSAIAEEEDLMEKKNIWDAFEGKIDYLDAVREAYPEDVQIQVSSLCCKLFVFFYGRMLPIMFDNPTDIVGYKFKLEPEDYDQLDAFESEIKHLLKSNRFDNQYPLYYSLGIIQMLRSKYKKAIPLFEKAIKHKEVVYRNSQSSVVSCYVNIIGAHMFLGNKKGAEKILQRKIDEKVEGDPVANDHLEMAYMKLDQKNILAAKHQLLKALRLDSNNILIYVNLGNVCVVEGNYVEAEEHLNSAFQITSDDPDMYRSLIALNIAKGELETANYMVDRYLEYDPESEFVLSVQKYYLSDVHSSQLYEK